MRKLVEILKEFGRYEVGLTELYSVANNPHNDDIVRWHLYNARESATILLKNAVTIVELVLLYERLANSQQFEGYPNTNYSILLKLAGFEALKLSVHLANRALHYIDNF